MKKYALLVDMGNCSQCHACVLACKDEHFGNDFLPYTMGIQELGENWINMHIEERGSGSMLRIACWPELCRHCADPDCAKESGAVTRRADGIVLIDPSKAKNDNKLADACPNRAIAWNGEKDIPQKCTLCAHLLDAGEAVPRCVEACPNGTLLFGDLNDPDSGVSRLAADIPEIAEQSGVVRYYNNPGRFIAGSVYLSETQTAEGADVQLFELVSAAHDRGEPAARARTNGFGDFKFSKLPENKRYEVAVTLDGYEPLVLEAVTDSDVCWEEITLHKHI